MVLALSVPISLLWQADQRPMWSQREVAVHVPSAAAAIEAAAMEAAFEQTDSTGYMGEARSEQLGACFGACTCSSMCV